MSFAAQDNSFYLLIPSDDYDNIIIAVNVINGKYASICSSANITNGGIAETNSGLSNGTVVITGKAIAATEQKSISFNVYKMKQR